MLNSEAIERDYRTMTCREMAVKYGVSHDMMRKFVSDLGIRDPKLEVLHHDRERVIKYRVKYRWMIHEIAEHLNRSIHWVKVVLREYRTTLLNKVRRVYDQARRAMQLCLFKPCVQLPLFSEDKYLLAA